MSGNTSEVIASRLWYTSAAVLISLPMPKEEDRKEPGEAAVGAAPAAQEKH